jgi:hypothetical protein
VIVLGCGVGDWFDCMVDAFKDYVGDAIEGLIKVIFQPILDALVEAVGNLMGTIATFWVFVDTPAIGSSGTGQPNDATVG